MKKLIVIEGPDRIGKTSLVSGLISAGIIYKFFNFPEKLCKDPVSILMNRMLTEPEFHNTDPSFKSLLFSVDRLRAKNELVRAVYSTDFPESPIVLCDRYTYSNIAYQIGLNILRGHSGKTWDELKTDADGIGNLVRYVEFHLMEMPRPDLTICLTSGNSDYFSVTRPERAEDDLNDSSIDLQKFINRFFRSEHSVVDQFNMAFWSNEQRMTVDVLSPGSIDFRSKDDILNSIIAELWTRGFLKQ